MWLELILFCGVALLLHRLLNPAKPFWEKHGVPQVNTSTFTEQIQVFLGKKQVSDFDAVAYQKLASTGGKFIGLVEMGTPFLLVKDLDLVKQFLIKDFEYFADRRQLVSSDSQRILNKVVINLEGDEWKGVRASMSPTFTTGKIRRMMDHFNNCSNLWTEHIKTRIIKNGKGVPLPVNIHGEIVSFAVDSIAAAGFGLNAGAISDPDSVFARMSKQLSDISAAMVFKFVMAMTFPSVLKFFGIPVFDQESVNFFQTILTQGLKDRMKGEGNRNDFIQLIVEARKGELKSIGADELSNFEKEAQLSGEDAQKGKKNYLADDEIAIAQAFIFFFAGFSTTSNFIGFVLYMLALHPEIQEKLRKEVDSKLFSQGDGKNVDYDELNGLVYMDMVVNEVLRKYPAATRLERKCVKDYYNPSENLRVPKGAMVSVPIDSIHNDKEFFEFPDKFYPEHFSPEVKTKRNPYAFMPFGSGPRNCIGMRFALVESKAVIAHLVHSFKIEPTAKTPIPPKVKYFAQGVQVPDGLELGFRLLK